VLQRVIAAVALVALASTPAVARTRLFCRYTGVEITDCHQQVTAGEIQIEGCCDRRTSQAAGAALITPHQEISSPPLAALPVPLLFSAPARRPPIRIADTGSRVFLITRALLL
jgi:hypothetical protein